jgi:hypothetical protein
MLGPLVLNRVGGEVHRIDVAVDKYAPEERTVELGKELPEPGGLSHAVGNSAVFRFSTGTGDHRLPLGRPGHQVTAQKDGVARGGAPSVRTPGPVGVSVDDELGGGREVQVQAVVNSPTQVTEEALESSEMGLSWIMHMEAYLLNCIGDVRPGECEILKCTSKTPVRSGVCHWVAL